MYNNRRYLDDQMYRVVSMRLISPSSLASSTKDKRLVLHRVILMMIIESYQWRSNEVTQHVNKMSNHNSTASKCDNSDSHWQQAWTFNLHKVVFQSIKRFKCEGCRNRSEKMHGIEDIYAPRIKAQALKVDNPRKMGPSRGEGGHDRPHGVVWNHHDVRSQLKSENRKTWPGSSLMELCMMILVYRVAGKPM